MAHSSEGCTRKSIECSAIGSEWDSNQRRNHQDNKKKSPTEEGRSVESILLGKNESSISGRDAELLASLGQEWIEERRTISRKGKRRAKRRRRRKERTLLASGQDKMPQLKETCKRQQQQQQRRRRRDSVWPSSTTGTARIILLAASLAPMLLLLFTTSRKSKIAIVQFNCISLERCILIIRWPTTRTSRR